jgi:hypothetical protein
MSTTLPPTLSESALSAALDEFAAALGSSRVLTGEADLKLYRDPFQHASSDEFTASAVLMPECVGEIQEVVRGDRELAQHEPSARDQRGVRLRGGRAGRAPGSTSMRPSGPATTV